MRGQAVRRVAMAAALLLSTAGAAAAAEGMPIRVTLNQVSVLTLERPAGTVNLADPSLANLAVDTPERLFLTGTTVGETNLLIYDRNGNKLFDRPLVVVPQTGPRNVTVRRGTAEAEALSCAPDCRSVAGGGRVPSGGAGAGGGGDQPMAGAQEAAAATQEGGGEGANGGR